MNRAGLIVDSDDLDAKLGREGLQDNSHSISNIGKHIPYVHPYDVTRPFQELYAEYHIQFETDLRISILRVLLLRV